MGGRIGGVLRGFPVLPIHGWLDGPRIHLLIVVALLPPLGYGLHAKGASLLHVLVVCLTATMAWQAVFVLARRLPITGTTFSSPLAPAIAVALMMPPDAPLWQVLLGVSFGAVVGAHLFGGYGWNFLNPVAVAVVFLIFSFPDGRYGGAPPIAWETVLPGTALLVATGVVSCRLLVGAEASLLIALHFLPSANVGPFQALTGFLFVATFLVCDPVAAPATNAGRWANGALVGVFVALGLASGRPETEIFVAAALLGGIFAPLVDQTVIVAGRRSRRRRIGGRRVSP